MENSSHSQYKTHVKFSSIALLNSKWGRLTPLSGDQDRNLFSIRGFIPMKDD